MVIGFSVNLELVQYVELRRSVGWKYWIGSRSTTAFPWCSGYHVCLTRRRSPVRSWAETNLAASGDSFDISQTGFSLRKIGFWYLKTKFRSETRGLKRLFSMEMRGVDPRASHMLSERSTIWATPPDNEPVVSGKTLQLMWILCIRKWFDLLIDWLINGLID